MKERISSGQVIDALRKGPFQEPAHKWLYEVRNGTGYSKQERYADGLVVSVWPSRGIWFAGVEVKVSRSDWKRELADPGKSAAIQKYCDYWWVAAAEGIVELAELPETWGLLTVSAKGKVTTVREAPKLTPEPLDQLFVASILRNQADMLKAARQAGFDEGTVKAREQYDVDAVTSLRGEVVAAQRAKDQAESQHTFTKRDLDELRETVKAFEREAGLPEGTVGVRSWQERNNYDRCSHAAGARYKAALLLGESNAETLAKRFREVANALDSVTESAKGAA